MKIGLYLAYPPQLGFSQGKEGLGRYWAMLAKGLHRRGNQIVIATTPWIEKSIRELLEEYRMDSRQVEFIIPKSVPVIWRLWEAYSVFRLRPRRPRRALNLLGKAAEAIVRALLGVRNVALFMMMGLLLGLALICLLPLALVLGGVSALVLFALRVFHIDPSKGKNIRGFAQSLSRFGGVPMLAARLFFSKLLSAESLETIRINSTRELHTLIAQAAEPPDVWYCPLAYWPEFDRLPGVKVQCFPDLVTEVFPMGFSELLVRKASETVRECMRNARHIITFSDYQKNAMVVNKLGKNPRDVVAIDLFVNETRPEIDIRTTMGRYSGAEARQRFARSLLQTLAGNVTNESAAYIGQGPGRYDMEQMEYIFYASQARPSKNILNLVRAYEILLRKKEVNFKLVLTCQLTALPELYEYVEKKRLSRDVLCFHRVSSQQLAALYACAGLSVNPTLFEGGFPFTFCEGMSVGTPSVMAAIPQVTDMLQGWNLEDCLFDPFDCEDMAERILYGWNNRGQLYARQLPLYEKLSLRSEEQAAIEYEEAFRYFIQRSKEAG